MFGIGITELIIIAIVALLVVGPKRLPDLAKSMGKGLSEFKRAADDVTDGIKESLQTDDVKAHTTDMKETLTHSQQTTEPPLPPSDPAADTSKKADPYAEHKSSSPK
jgi:Tat protein translocase TatB subunit